MLEYGLRCEQSYCGEWSLGARATDYASKSL